ncbi:hypothetical protein [Hyphomonas sp.]|uniref:hypothetical protein n=1 Tax=Hyphomonas sp. TaxID=87 RepID=UPI003529AC4D
MLDRIELISAVNGFPLKISATAQRALHKTLDKALGQMLVALPLEAAQAATATEQRMIIEAFTESLSMADLKKISKLWEPKRTVTSSVAQTELARDLEQLLFRSREPFKPTTLSLAQVRSLSDADRGTIETGIRRFATASQAKALLRKWDKHNNLKTGGGDAEIRERLLDLIAGAEAVPKPPKG